MEQVTFNTLVTIGSYIIIASGLYWKLRIDITKINLQIADIQCDRKDKWLKHDEKQDKSDAYFSDIMRGLAEIKGDIKVVKTHIKFLEKNHE